MIAIIGVLVALLLPAVQQSREAARRIECSNHLKQISLGIHNFENAQQTLPSSRLGPQHATWFVQILPYIEQGNLYNSWNLANTYYVQQTTTRTTQVGAFYCPSRRSSMLSTQFEVSSTGLPDTQQYPGVLGDYAANGGQFAGAIVDNPLCNGVMCQADSQLTNNQVVETQVADPPARHRRRDKQYVPRRREARPPEQVRPERPVVGRRRDLQRRLPPQLQPDRRSAEIQPGPGARRSERPVALQVRQRPPRHLPVRLLRRPRGVPEEFDRHDRPQPARRQERRADRRRLLIRPGNLPSATPGTRIMDRRWLMLIVALFAGCTQEPNVEVEPSTTRTDQHGLRSSAL